MSASATLSTFRPENHRRGKPSAPGPATRDTRSLSASPSRSSAKRSFAEAAPNLRVLVVFEDQYRAYRDAIAGAIQALRPHAEVAVAEPDSLETDIERLESHLVICNRPNFPDHEATLAWVELPHETGRAATVWLEGKSSEAADPTLDGLLAIIDEVGRLVETPRSTRGYSRRTKT